MSVPVSGCADCGSKNPYLIDFMGDGRMVCEARQMLAEGVPAEVAAAHAKKRRPW